MLASVVAAQLLVLTTNVCTTGSTRTCKLSGCAVAAQICLQDRTWGACTCNCDDGNPCTTDTWSGTTCEHGAVAVDDGNSCTVDSCDPTVGVRHVPMAAGTSCSDGNACNGVERCDAGGTCVAGTPPPLDDGNACTADSCDPAVGVRHLPVAPGTPCSDGNACNGLETCDAAATCIVGTPIAVDDSNPCTADACDPVAGVTHVPVAAGVSCSDGDACNGAEVCDGGGSCLAGAPLAVDDGNACTVDSCDAVAGVVHEPAAAGASCSDGDFCNGFETCDGVGGCLAGLAPAVDDQNVCTLDRCDPTLGVFHDPVAASTPCGDADACNGLETCDGAGACVAGAPPPVDDGNVCTTDACDPSVGPTHTPIAGCFVIPPDPVTVAPPNDLTVATTVADSTAFLYTGANPIQTGVAPGTIEPRRAAVLRGRVLALGGEALAGVTVAIEDHPELGSTVSRGDGSYDLAVNGGGSLRVSFTRYGHLTAQRAVETPWNEYTAVPDVALVPLDPEVTTVELGAPGMQSARGSVVSDGDGVRQATVLVPAGTQATVRYPDGTIQALGSLRLRATEYTVGPNGPAAMPGELPSTSGYTYAVELSADEALDAGADVQFSQPLAYYVDNFLGIPVGEAVPAGYYDRARGAWVASKNGRVIAIVAIANGIAEVDTNGDALADDAATLAALGIDTAEQERLAALYHAGDTLWRTPITHFTPYDLNFPWACFDDNADGKYDCVDPDQPPPTHDEPERDPCRTSGSIIECQNQVLGEEVSIAGTPFRLVYRSDRVPGRTAERTIQIQATSSTVPFGLLSVVVRVAVAGQMREVTLPAAPSQVVTFTWDGKDAYGRPVQGEKPVAIALGYVYKVRHLSASDSDFAFASASLRYRPISLGRSTVTIWQSWRTVATSLAQPLQDLGAWTLDVHHSYDPVGQLLFRGDGEVSSSNGRTPVVKVLATFSSPRGVAAAPDGTLLVADFSGNKVFRVWQDGTKTVVAGGGTSTAEGVPATQADVWNPNDVSLAPDGTFYIAENARHRVRKVTPDGLITTVAGTGTIYGAVGDGGPATQAVISYPYSVTATPDGTLYIGEHARVRRVDRNGIITSLTGGEVPSTSIFTDDGRPAAQSKVCSWSAFGSFSVDRDGSLLVACNRGAVLRITPDGIVHKIAGTGVEGFGGDGGDALQAQFYDPWAAIRGSDGSLYIADSYNYRIRRVSPDGVTETFVGQGRVSDNLPTNNMPAALAKLGDVRDLAIGPDGLLYVADLWKGLLRISPAFPGLTLTDTVVPSPDGREVYFFDGGGRHQRTVDSVTGRVLYQFQYGDQHRLASVTDGDGNVTRIERDASGRLAAIVAPWGQRTVLGTDADGRLTSIANPEGDTVAVTYRSGGLLETYTDPAGSLHRFEYDALGRLTSDANPAGGLKTLARGDDSSGKYAVTVTTALGRTSTYSVEPVAAGGRKLTNTSPDGTTTTTIVSAAEVAQTTSPDGTVAVVTPGPDPRFGMESPVESRKVTTPGGLSLQVAQTRSATLSNSANPLSVTSSTETVAVNGRSYTSTYTASSHTVAEKTPVGRTTTLVLDATGRVSEVRPPGMSALAVSYDSSGRPWRMTQASRSWTIAYDGDGWVQSVTDPMQRSVAMTYDRAGRLATQTLPGARTVGFEHDRNGNVTGIAPPGRPSHGFGYDAVDRVTTYVPPAAAGSGPTTYAYDLDGMLAQVVPPDARTITPAYYPLTQPPDVGRTGRLASLTTWRGATSFDYDLEGRLSTVTAPDGGAVSFGYDGFLATAESWSGAVSGSVGRAYDANLRVTSTTVNGASAVSYAYDNDNLLTQAGALAIARVAATGRVSGTTLGVVTTTPTYDTTYGELKTFGASASAMSLYSYTLTRDLAGRITGKTETVQGTTTPYEYAYDDAGRLWTVKVNGTIAATYLYDQNGNRLSRTTGAGAEEGTYDDQDRLLAYGGATYGYGASGELESRTVAGATSWYSYDPSGNLVWAQLPDGTTIDYVVDGLNRRVGKKVNGALVEGFLYDGQLRPAAWLDGAGQVYARFVYGLHANVPEYMVTASGTYRFVTDHLGSPRLVVDSSTGAVVQRMDFDEWGNVTYDSSPGFQPFGFAGGLYDRDTGLVRFGARDYDGSTGRWTTKDPVGLEGGLNVYEYAANDPIDRLDPPGLYSWWEFELDGSNFIMGMGDALTFGASRWARNELGLGQFAKNCSNAYFAGEVASFFIGSGRLAYAGAAKALPWLIRGGNTVERALEISAARNELKLMFRLGTFAETRMPDAAAILQRYGSAEAIIAAATRTNFMFNLAGAWATGGAAANYYSQ